MVKVWDDTFTLYTINNEEPLQILKQQPDMIQGVSQETSLVAMVQNELEGERREGEEYFIRTTQFFLCVE